jgi:predicted RNA-binding Zn ribbon-like protein
VSGHAHPAAAPAALELRPRLGVADLLALANTRHGPAGHWHARPRADGPDHDHLASPADALRWLVDHGVGVPGGLPTEAQLRSLAAIRELVRGLVDDPSADLGPDVRERLDRAAFRVVPPDTVVAAAPGWDGFADDLLLPMLDVVAHRELVRRCANPLCRFTFLDRSRNRSRRWCDPRGCGNRIRVRRHRAARLG